MPTALPAAVLSDRRQRAGRSGIQTDVGDETKRVLVVSGGREGPRGDGNGEGSSQ